MAVAVAAVSCYGEAVAIFLISFFPKMLRARSLLKRAVLGRSMSAATVPGVTPLIEHDPEMHNLLEQEAERQRGGLELIGTLACVSPIPVVPTTYSCSCSDARARTVLKMICSGHCMASQHGHTIS